MTNTLNSTTSVKEEFVEFDIVDRFIDYEEFVNEAADYQDAVYPVLGLAGEAGEFLELVKKAWREAGDEWWKVIDLEKAESELGDILWYLTRIADVLDLDLEGIATANVKKIMHRRKYGKSTNVVTETPQDQTYQRGTYKTEPF